MEAIKTKEENPNGLHARYEVKKIIGETDPNAEYFVLRLDKSGSDPKHIEACRKAILEYAYFIKDHLPDLALDIIERYNDPKNDYMILTDSEVYDMGLDYLDLSNPSVDAIPDMAEKMDMDQDHYGNWIDWEGRYLSYLKNR